MNIEGGGVRLSEGDRKGEEEVEQQEAGICLELERSLFLRRCESGS